MFYVMPLLLIAFLGILFYYSLPEVIHTNKEALAPEEINKPQYPWFGKNIVTEVKKYSESYDINSDDWIAYGDLTFKESRELAYTMDLMEDDEKASYRCEDQIAEWAPAEICDYVVMEEEGFLGYSYRPPECDEYCVSYVVMWIHSNTGEFYLIGSNDKKN